MRDDVKDKETLRLELATHLAAARDLRAAQAADAAPEDFRRLKAWQAERLAATYGDLLAEPRYRPAAEFFLSDLYGPKDFSPRDDEVARVLPIMVGILPARALATLAEAMRMDALSESLDMDMVRALRRAGDCVAIDRAAYAAAYRDCGRRQDRELQIELISVIGTALDRLTHVPMVRTSLRLMRKPAQLAGLGNLQSFLQRGFDAFGSMGSADYFLNTIIGRETALMKEFFATPRR